MSLTASNSEHYSTAPSEWIFNTSMQPIGKPCPTARNVGMFCNEINIGDDRVDAESDLLGLDKRINKCGAELDIFKSADFMEPSDNIKMLYQGENATHEEDFLTPLETRNQRPCNMQDVSMHRPDILLYNPQQTQNIVFEERLRGGEWSRNLHRDNYTCESNDTRGGNK